METLMSLAMLTYAIALSFLLAMWIAWMSLRGLFRMLPANKLAAIPVRGAGQPVTGAIGHHAAKSLRGGRASLMRAPLLR